MTYATSPEAYLGRARERLLSGEVEDLFYAAFELRCCVESRQADYLDALETRTGRKVKAWQVRKTANTLLQTWRDPKICRLTYVIGDKQFPTYFTPVTSELARAVERHIGPLMHAPASYHEARSPWWDETRSRLVNIYRQAWVSCQGEHRAPPLWNERTRETHPMKLYVTPTSEALITYLTALSGRRGSFELRVEYLDDPPPEWLCDL